MLLAEVDEENERVDSANSLINMFQNVVKYINTVIGNPREAY